MLTLSVFQTLDNKIHETVESINQLKISREFFLSFAKDPQQFINKWLISQTRDLKVNKPHFFIFTISKCAYKH